MLKLEFRAVARPPPLPRLDTQGIQSRALRTCVMLFGGNGGQTADFISSRRQKLGDGKHGARGAAIGVLRERRQNQQDPQRSGAFRLNPQDLRPAFVRRLNAGTATPVALMSQQEGSGTADARGPMATEVCGIVTLITTPAAAPIKAAVTEISQVLSVPVEPSVPLPFIEAVGPVGISPPLLTTPTPLIFIVTPTAVKPAPGLGANRT